MPTATDLVTDLPADFEVFGQAVATSMADLLGGTTGQILSKATNADMDFTWTSANPGDITGVTAGTGISGGGTSGAVTITNDMATTITASGDIVVGTGSGTYDNLPIGTTGQVLIADTTVSPYKVKWAAPAASPFVGCVILDNSPIQSVANNTSTAITWNSESFDTDGFHDTSTNTSRITIPAGKGGKYLVIGQVSWDNNTSGYRNVQLYKNGSNVRINAMTPSSQYPSQPIQSAILDLVATDYLEIYCDQNSGGARDVYKGTNSIYGSFSVQYLGA